LHAIANLAHAGDEGGRCADLSIIGSDGKFKR
jgi:hypothetical protein